MTNYQKGKRVEDQVKHLFEKDGWTVTRAAASKGPHDLVAIKETAKNRKYVYYIVGLMQVKVAKWRKGRKASMSGKI